MKTAQTALWSQPAKTCLPHYHCHHQHHQGDRLTFSISVLQWDPQRHPHVHQCKLQLQITARKQRCSDNDSKQIFAQPCCASCWFLFMQYGKLSDWPQEASQCSQMAVVVQHCLLKLHIFCPYSRTQPLSHMTTIHLQNSTCKVSLHTYAICNSDRGPVTENKDKKCVSLQPLACK